MFHAYPRPRFPEPTGEKTLVLIVLCIIFVICSQLLLEKDIPSVCFYFIVYNGGISFYGIRFSILYFLFKRGKHWSVTDN